MGLVCSCLRPEAETSPLLPTEREDQLRKEVRDARLVAVLNATNDRMVDVQSWNRPSEETNDELTLSLTKIPSATILQEIKQYNST
ncbi:hypothetical protein DAMA08_022910 [Martiniozyma asiatica (nom. inval.)]|nr:hypothetical protein DAMA08_022910 [Martiniozyma asiatica]